MVHNLAFSGVLRKTIGLLAVFFCVWALAGSPGALALDGPVNKLQSPDARRLTVEAIQAMEKERWAEAQKKIAQSKDPLASKLYHWRQFQRAGRDQWDAGFFVRLSHFIRQNPDWPGIGALRRQAEQSMPKDLPVADVLGWFADYPPRTPEGMSRYLDALIARGRGDEARKVLADWWAEILVSRDLQREIFQKFGQYLTLDAHKKRFDLLLLNGHYANARAIAGVLGQGYPELAEARIALAENKGGVNALIDKVPSYLQSDPGLLYERLKWRRKHDMDFGALEILHNPPDPEKVGNPDAWWQERHILIRRLLEERKCKSAYSLAEKHIQKDGLPYAQAEWLTGWLALRCMKEPTQAYERFTAMYAKVETPISKARAAYWAGRAAKDMRQEDLAKDWYRKAAQFQTVYYGQIARRDLALEEELPRASVPSLSSSDIDAFQRKELVQAAQLYHAAGLRGTASDFIRAFVESEHSPKAYRFGAELAAKMGQYHDAVKIAKDATKEGLFLTAQAFPLLGDMAQGHSGVETALIHALVRQESMFDQEAMSSAGARGLMQLLPSTAREIAGKEKISYNADWLTQRPGYNIRLGASYVRRLLKRYDNSYALAAAAYNAGPGRVDQWIATFGDPRKGEIDVLDWIELMPVYETRNYVQRVMENLYVYRILLKDGKSAQGHNMRVATEANP